MPSFISNSENRAWLYSKLLILICVALAVAVEVSSDYLLRHHSETYARVSRQYSEAAKVRPSALGTPISVLMVGNSLLLDGIDVKRLQESTSGRIRIYPIFLEGTGYYDWFYALQRLFREGSRPQVVVLGVGVNTFLSNSVRQDYVPLMLWDLRDAFLAASDLKMDRTATSNLLLAHSSVFWDTRSVLRTQILRHAVPNYQNLISLLKAQPDLPPAAQFSATVAPRLQRLQQLCQAYAATLIILVPPVLSAEDAVQQMTRTSREVGVETLVPIRPAMLTARYYQPDQMHLNSEGAALFTSALAAFLPSRVDHKGMASAD
jgi:hypothetical protein